jgi:hypothetical protein
MAWQEERLAIHIEPVLSRKTGDSAGNNAANGHCCDFPGDDHTTVVHETKEAQ